MLFNRVNGKCQFIIVALVLLVGVWCSADTIVVDNYSFELPGMVKIKGWDGTGAAGSATENVPGWSSDTTATNSGVESDSTSPDGDWRAFLMNNDPAVWQLTDHVLEAGETLTLKVASKNTAKGTTLWMKIYYDDAGTRVTAASQEVTVTSSWQEFELLISSDDVPAAVGHQVGILFNNTTNVGGTSNWLGIDNVRMEAITGYVSEPTNLAVAAVSYDSATLDWDDNPAGQNVIGYNIYRADSSNGTYVSVGTAAASTFTDESVNDCVNYYYKVTAVNASNESDLSSSAAAVIPCRGDADGNDVVNIDDLVVLAGEWVTQTGTLDADFDDSGKVDNVDLAILASGWQCQRPVYGHPNIVWLMAEDCSKHWYELFDPTYGKATPNIESLASSGLVFNNAYSNIAVCSPARSTLVSGCYASRIGIQWHRKTTSVNFPAGLQPFPAYLRNAGYYTTNSTKQDYNINVSGAWDNSSAAWDGWRNRPTSDTPFFHVYTIYTSHESSIQTDSDINSPTTDPASVNLYPVHPDTTTFRKTYATYFDKIKSVDNSVGSVISALQSDSLLEDTFIFFFGDNGGTVAGSKGYITNTGLHVPLVVRVPANWQYLAPTSPDGRVDGFVSFEDFGATALKLAGLDIPTQMDGVPFLGLGVTLEDINAEDEVFCTADRFDEQYNLCRSLQKGDFKYVRNYEPFYPYALFNNYRYIMLAQQEWKTLFDAGSLNADQSLFFEPREGEELYDIASDPFETTNLAADPTYAATLADLRDRLYQRVTGMPDIGILPEAVFLNEGGPADGAAYGQANQARITRYVDIADLMLDSYANVSSQLATHLASSDPMDRFWAMTVCAVFGTDAAGMRTTVETLVATETDPFVLSRAAVFLGELARPISTVESVLKDAVLSCGDKTESLHVLNDAVHLQDTLGYSFTTIRSGNVVGTSGWLTNRISHLGW